MLDRRDLRWAGVLALARIAMQFVLFARGFRVLTLDDYLRASVLPGLVTHWRWFPDPFFLPAYFWAYSVPAFLHFPLSIGVIALTVFFAALSSSLLFLLLRKSGVSPWLSAAASLLFSFQPLPVWLGGVPLSETLGLAILLACLLLWDSPDRRERFSAAGLMAILSLLRYEAWPFALIFAVFTFADRRSSRRERSARAGLSLAGFLVFVLWRLSTPDPLGPVRFSQTTAELFMDPALRLGRVAWGALALMPLTLFALPSAGIRLFSCFRERHAFSLLGAWTAWSVLSLFLPLVGVGYYPLVFPERITLVPGVLLWLCAVPIWSPRAEKFSRPATALLVVGLLAVMARTTLNPEPEIKEETLRAARVLGSSLASLPSRTILVQRRDLGWTVLWGLNDGNERIVFDRPNLQAESPLGKPPGVLSLLRNHPDAACVLSATRQAQAAATEALPSWRRAWADGKYALYCEPAVIRTVSGALR